MSDTTRRRRVGPAEQQYGRAPEADGLTGPTVHGRGRTQIALPPAWVTALVLLVLAGVLVLVAVLV